MRLAIPALAGLALAPAALAQHIDIELFADNNRITTGLIDRDAITSENPCPILSLDARVYDARLDDGSIPHFENFPGFNACPGTFDENTFIGFDVVDALRVWNGTDFGTIPANETMFISSGGAQPIFVETPANADGFVEGFNLALTTATGSMHTHVQYILSSTAGTPTPGVYMLTLALDSENTSLEASEPIFLVFADGVPQQELDDAVAYVRDVLVDPTVDPCPADIDGDDDVDFGDFLALSAEFGRTGCDAADPCAADIDGDGSVDFGDFLALSAVFGAGPETCAE